MKNIFWVVMLVGTTTFWFGCNKKSTSVDNCPYTVSDLYKVYAPGSEVNALSNYIKQDSIDAIKDPRGFYYKIDTSGSAEKPQPCADVTINYVGRLSSDKIFDQAQSAQFNLNGLILGWQVGLPLIGRGGKITLYLPPSFGYGSNELNGIPANSILIFSIELINFTNP